MSKNPVYTPYKDFQDILDLKRQFFDFTPERDERTLAISRVKALMTKGRLPHAIECTSLLSSSIMNDPFFASPNESPAGSNAEGRAACSDSSLLKLTYTMTLIRFVNGLLDPFQQSTHAIPLHTLAKNMNLPTWFVELRHQGTHESLPSLSMLRMGAKEALDWLWVHYWLPLDEDNQQGPVVAPTEELDDQSPIRVRQREEFKELLREYRRIKRDNLSRVFRFGDSTEVGAKYWKAVNKLVKLFHQDDSGQFFKVLLFKNVLVLSSGKGMKFAQLTALYAPLFEHIQRQSSVDEVTGEVEEGFYEALVMALLESVDAYHAVSSDPSGLRHQTDAEVAQAVAWLKHLIVAHTAPKQTNRLMSKHLLVPIESTVYKLRECGNIPSSVKLELLTLILTFAASKGNSPKFVNEAVSVDEVDELKRYVKFITDLEMHRESSGVVTSSKGAAVAPITDEMAPAKRNLPVDAITQDLARLQKRMRAACDQSRAVAEAEVQADAQKVRIDRYRGDVSNVKSFARTESWFAYAFGEEYS